MLTPQTTRAPDLLGAVLKGLAQALLARGEDPTDEAVWEPAKEAFLTDLIEQAQRQLPHRAVPFGFQRATCAQAA